VKIVALDPPDMSPDAIMARFESLPSELKPVYSEYLSLAPNPLNILCWRNAKHKEFADDGCFRRVTYYAQDTHQPYEVKTLRDAIVRELCAESEATT
jgi:hypothetical protein